MQGAWIRMFHHLESTNKNSQKFKLSSCNKMEEQKEFNKPLFFFNIYVFVNNYFVSVSKSYRIFM